MLKQDSELAVLSHTVVYSETAAVRSNLARVDARLCQLERPLEDPQK